jgi:hypothetical protein
MSALWQSLGTSPAALKVVLTVSIVVEYIGGCGGLDGRDGWMKGECRVGVREEFYPMICILAGVLEF